MTYINKPPPGSLWAEEKPKPAPKFDGETFDEDLDGERLATQLERVRLLMADGKWRTLGQIAAAIGCTEPSASARLRDLRKPRFGGHEVERARCRENTALWYYRVVEVTR